jgi:2TM domain
MRNSEPIGRLQMATVDEERREAAIKRIKERNSFKIHLFTYLVVNAMLVVLWAISGNAITVPTGLPTTSFWPIFPIVGWGVGLAIHGYNVYRGNHYTEEQIEREMKSLPR